MMGRYQAKTGERLTVRGLAKAAGVSASTVGTDVLGSKKRVDIQTIDKLLTYFRSVLEQPVTVADLIEYVPDKEVE
ncbi:MAG: helix-turn-helix transcriptional regulator [Caldilineaceae bacterium]|nr:helix-turn-helix transcriptional regulator [Caldilineaceae bacterium]MCB0145464.1 helix-turn-helix transcriptional regulator [Caldilineaceae bacterium]